MAISNLSYWEKSSWFSDRDVCIIGAGIVGLGTAIFLKRKFSNLNISVLDKGFLPDGGSTKNAGFACFGSLSEIAADLKTLSEDQVYQLINKRYQGLSTLRSLIGDKNLQYYEHGGYELFTSRENHLFEESINILDKLNSWLKDISGKANVYQEIQHVEKRFGFKHIENTILNSAEGQVHTGMMMQSMLKLAREAGVEVILNCSVNDIQAETNGYRINLANAENMHCNHLVVATNAYASQLIPELDVQAGRAQVLITEPIKDLKVEGCFHMDEGYLYFRNIDNRILLGGGRNLDKEAEETFNKGTTELIQNRLEELLKTVILPDNDFRIDRTWSGTLGLGNNREPIVLEKEKNLYIGVRMGGMGVAIGSGIGKELSEMIGQNL